MFWSRTRSEPSIIDSGERDRRDAEQVLEERLNLRPELARAIVQELVDQGLLLDGQQLIAVREVISAWSNPGPSPSFHQATKFRLERGWPVLYRAVTMLERSWRPLGRD